MTPGAVRSRRSVAAPLIMKKVALVFVVAVFLPSLVLAWLAVRSLRDQQLVLEHQQSFSAKASPSLSPNRSKRPLPINNTSSGAKVEEMLAHTTAFEVAASFDERLRTNWPMASVGFVVTIGGQLLAPSVRDRLEAENFVLANGGFLSNTMSAEVYWNANPPGANPAQLNYYNSNSPNR